MNTVELSKSIIKRKIITSILTISLVMGSFSFAFAHPTTADDLSDALSAGWSNTNGLMAPYGKDMGSSWFYIFGHDSLAMLRDMRYQLTGNDYDTHTGTSLYTHVNNIYQSLTSNSSGSILYGINQTNTKLSDIYNSIGVGGAGNNVLTKLSSLVNGQTDVNQSINTIINNGIDVSLSQTVEDSITNIETVLTTPLFNPYNYVRRNDVYSVGNFQTINNNKYYPVVTMNNPDGRLAWDSVTINSNMDFLSAIYNGILGVNNRLATMGTAYKSTVYTSDGAISQNSLYSIQDSLVVYGDNNSEQNNTIIEQLKTIDSDYNNIEWQSLSNILYVTDSIDGGQIPNSKYSKKFYIDFQVSFDKGNVFKVTIPISSYNDYILNPKIDVGIKYNNIRYSSDDIYVYKIEPSNIPYCTDIYISFDYDLIGINPIFYIYIENEHNMYFNYSYFNQCFVYYTENSNDRLDIEKNIYLYNLNKLVTQAKEMFFDDETLQAKKNNSGQTTAVLTGFTGSGQASATANDYGTLSTGVSNVKGGMNTNVSANNAFGIFNNQSGYSFWSSDTLQELNQSRPNTRSNSKSINDDGYEYYNNRLEYLHNIMLGGDDK